MKRPQKERLVLLVTSAAKKELVMVKRATGLTEEEIFDLGLRYIRKKAEFERRQQLQAESQRANGETQPIVLGGKYAGEEGTTTSGLSLLPPPEKPAQPTIITP